MTPEIESVNFDKINRGDLIMTAGGFVVADTLSAAGTVEQPAPFWYDTDRGRHFPNPTDGTLQVRANLDFFTQDIGQDDKGVCHILLNPMPDTGPQSICPDAQNARLDMWGSGTALASVTCPACRKATGVIGRYASRRSNGI